MIQYDEDSHAFANDVIALFSRRFGGTSSLPCVFVSLFEARGNEIALQRTQRQSIPLRLVFSLG
jgi:hypothetical protein